ncbi:hypothetical protein [Amycolatopsis thermophila]|uniref:Uncharacterized protein n=1 Tax=Amycolatopsis thermophila TaxID=206084 RepID=A0ABU0ES41_9PSEU|nr:hypothetical protein [Amycolatopsis thermophila]MDQ0377918.1 hypothetical protein [Amycolatopsis thermophila]
MNLPHHTNPPNEAEAMEITDRYLQIATAIAGPSDDIRADVDRVTDMLVDYFTDDPMIASLRLRYFAGIGPVLVAGAMKKAHRGAMPRGGFWAIEQVGAGDTDPNALAAAQAVTFQLNGDQDASHDVLDAHFAVVAKHHGPNAAHDALFDVVLHHLQMLAALIKNGVFDDR